MEFSPGHEPGVHDVLDGIYYQSAVLTLVVTLLQAGQLLHLHTLHLSMDAISS